MQLPCIHMNGTSKESLIEALCRASEALDAAYQALKQTAPNGRDYYPLGNTALTVAIREHDARLKAVDAVKEEIDQLTVEIDRQ